MAGLAGVSVSARGPLGAPRARSGGLTLELQVSGLQPRAALHSNARALFRSRRRLSVFHRVRTHILSGPDALTG